MFSHVLFLTLLNISKGISMTLLQSKDGIQHFTFEHGRDYQQVQFKFLDAVESMDPNNIVVKKKKKSSRLHFDFNKFDNNVIFQNRDHQYWCCQGCMNSPVIWDGKNGHLTLHRQCFQSFQLLNGYEMIMLNHPQYKESTTAKIQIK